ncbi:MAG: GNAT family N-acetyltransferase [Actinomycetota bacterium]|nr:GNAT family N-acetyltransferase [Actinomycetota bacterium]
MAEIETARLRLRHWRTSDAEPYARLSADPEVVRYISPGAPLTRAQARRAIEALERHWRQKGFGHWAAEDKETGTLAGRVGLLHHPDWPEEREAVEVGWIVDSAFRGRGLATEGALASLRFGFERAGLDHIISIAEPDNVSSLRVMEKIGLAFEGETEWRGRRMVWYGVDRSTWRSGREAEGQ